MHVPAIRPATENDLQRLVDVEIEAGQLFHAVGMSEVAEDVPQVAELREAVTAERVWVAEVGAQGCGIRHRRADRWERARRSGVGGAGLRRATHR